MSWVEILRFSVQGLVANRLRSLLTMLGIIIGIAAVILLTAIGNGASQYIQNQITGLGATSITVFGQSPAASSEASSQGRPLTMEDADALDDQQGAPDIASVSPVVRTPVTVAAGTASTSTDVIGSVPSYFPGANVKVAVGRPYDDQDVHDARKVVLLGRGVADDVFGVGSNPVGREVSFNNVPFRVIGVLQPQGQAGGLTSPDDSALAPITAVQNSLTGFGNLSQIVVQATSTQTLAAAESEVNSILDRRHEITEPDERDYQVVSARQLSDVLNQTLGAFTVLLGAIAAISLVVGGIGITNIMLVSVTERTREIGIRKALGAPPSAILWQFLTEATILSLIGGAIGVAIGFLGTLVPLGTLTPKILPSAVVLAVCVSAGIGIFFGAYPARRAARLRPIEALRRE